MHTKINNTIKIFLLLGVLFAAPLFTNSGMALSAELVNINRADAATMIANWKGIGEKKAKAIVAYRKKNGNFASINDLLNVKGIGEGLIKKNKKYMSVKSGAKTTAKVTAKKPKKKATTKKKKTDSKKTTTKKPATKKKSSTKTKDKKKKKK